MPVSEIVEGKTNIGKGVIFMVLDDSQELIPSQLRVSSSIVLPQKDTCLEMLGFFCQPLVKDLLGFGFLLTIEKFGD